MHGMSSDISRTIWGIADKSDLVLIKHSFRGMVAAAPLTTAMTMAQAGVQYSYEDASYER